jgi:hypothetical protein
MQIGVQQGPESVPVTCEDRFVSSLADVVHLDIIVRGGARMQTIPKGSWNVQSCRCEARLATRAAAG